MHGWLLSAFMLFVLPCVQVAALRRADTQSKVSYRLCIKSINWKSGQVPTKGCRAIIIIIIIIIISYVILDVYCCVHESTPRVPVLSQNNLERNFMFYYLKIRFNITLLFPIFLVANFPTKFASTFIIPPTNDVPRPSNYHSFDERDERYKLRTLSLRSFNHSPSSYFFRALRLETYIKWCKHALW
jgi:hypothetical protein